MSEPEEPREPDTPETAWKSQGEERHRSIHLELTPDERCDMAQSREVLNA